MRLLIQLTVLMLCVSVLLTGCDPAMRQPITEIVTPPQDSMEIVTPPQDSLEMDSLEKAQAAMESVNERRTEAQQTAEDTGDFSTIFTASEDIFKEELGLERDSGLI